MEDSPEQRTQTIGILVLCTFAIAIALHWLSAVMIPFVLATLIALTVRPAIQLLTTRLHVPRGVSVLLVVLIVGFLLNVLAGLIISSVQQLSSSASTYANQFQLTLQRINESVPYELLGIDDDQLRGPMSLVPQGTVAGIILGFTNSLLDFASKGLLVLIFVFFMLIGEPPPPSDGRAIRNELEAQVRSYIFTKTLISAATGVTVGGILMALGIDLAVVFGLLAFLLNFVPSLGSIIATLLPLPVVLVNPDIGPVAATLAIALPGLVQLVVGNFIDPMVMGDSLDLHPVTILLSLMIWGAIWGIVGMLLATPITAIAKLLLERSDRGKPLAGLLAGRIDGLWSAPRSPVP